jgi:tetratricopeptide (TPR) repeat protein
VQQTTPPTADIGGPAPTSLGRIPPGTHLGRYLLGESIGEGGAGVVYAAHDPELNRKVAIKVVRPVAKTQARLLREARAMARLSHPNVVQVHDVGTFGEQVFVAMEFVDGWTAREWIAREHRSSKEILDVFLLAGRGIAAAHDVGFVHRDFKPDNVLVGRDGAVRVTDFGLACVRGGDDVAITAVNTAVGTPGYMAPEQYAAGKPDPRSDQFGFCASVYEALYERRPFDAETIEGVKAATISGQLTASDFGLRREVPAHVHRTLMRGLARSPDARFPSMRALLAALDPKPRAVWGPLAMIATAALGVAGAVWGLHANAIHRETICRGAEAHLVGVWDSAQREQVRRSFAATGLPFADVAFTGVSAQLDRFSRDWVSMRTDACRAVRVLGEQSEEEFALRTACLNGRLRELASLVALLASADRDVVLLAVEAGGKLSPVGVCGDMTALAAPIAVPSDPHIRSEVEAIRARLADARALAATGRVVRATHADEGLLAEARNTAYAPLVAEVLVDLGAALTGAGKYDDAARVLTEAVEQADESHHDEARVQALVLLAEVSGRWLGHYARGAEYATSAVAVARRIRDPRLESFALEQASREHGFTDELDRALEEARQSVVLTDRFFDPSDLRRARVHSSASVALSELARFDEAEHEDEVALAIAEHSLGTTHPGLHEYLEDLALDLVWSGRPADAIAYDERAVALVRAQLGVDHPQYANAINNLAYAELATGRYADSITLNEQALGLWERNFGAEYGSNAYALVELGEAYLGEGQPARALPLLERATRLAEASGLEAETMGDCRFFYGRATWEASHDAARAEGLVRKAIESYGHIPRLAARRKRAEAWLADQGGPRAR